VDDLLDASVRAKHAVAEKEAVEARLAVANSSLALKEKALMDARECANTLSE